jgi:hypothetical protein
MKTTVNLGDVLGHFIDEVSQFLTGDEVKLYLYIARNAFTDDGGYLARLTPAQMMEATGLDGQQALTALTALIQYDVVIEHDDMTADGRQYGINASPNMQGLKERAK